MTTKELLASFPKAKAGDVRIIILTAQSAALSVLPYKDIEETIGIFEKRASLGKSDRKSQEAHGSIRIWAAELLAEANPGKASLALLPSAALWMTLRHWKQGDRNTKKLAEIAKQKKPLFIALSFDGKDPASEAGWKFEVAESLPFAEDDLCKISDNKVRMV